MGRGSSTTDPSLPFDGRGEAVYVLPASGGSGGAVALAGWCLGDMLLISVSFRGCSSVVERHVANVKVARSNRVTLFS